MLLRDRYLTARQASAALGVSLPTLYAYVSRGMLSSEPVGGRARIRRYLKEDVLRLLERRDLRRNPAKAAEKSLHWGTPLLQSGLTLIDRNRLFYRGLDATELAEHSTLEEVAALLWTGDSVRASTLFAGRSESLPRMIASLSKRYSSLGPVERCQFVLPLAASSDLSAYDLRPASVVQTGARILRIVFSAVAGSPVAPPLELALARAWLPKRTSAAHCLRVALILCADHELNISAFTARCIASAQATLYEVVLGAMAAFRGRRHGGISEAVETLFRDAEQVRDCRKVVAARLQSLGYIPGFGHQLYPEGDPRAEKLLLLAKMYESEVQGKLTRRLIQAAHTLAGERPNLDFGLAAFARALALPSEAPIAIFGLGRTIGWIAHAIEQYADNQMIRPRARYTGPIPTD